MSDDDKARQRPLRGRYTGHSWWWWALAALCAAGIIGSLLLLYI